MKSNDFITEYGDTKKGQKMLTKVQKRAVDRVTSKKADTDPAYAKKNSDAANRAWDRMSDKDLEEGWTKLPSGDYQNSHTGVRTSKPPVKKKRGQKTGAEWDAIKAKKEQGVAEGQDDLSQYSTERLQAYVKKVSGGGVPAFGSGAKLKRVQAELKRREQGVAEAELAEPPAPERKQQTQTKTKPKFDYDPFQQQKDQPIAKADPLDDLKKNAGMGGNKPEVNIRKASQASTLNKTSGLATDDMANMLGKMKDIEISPDLEPYEQEPEELLPSVEVNTQNLPAVAGQALQAAGVQDPEFHQVANLPGNMADQIRQLGKSLFGALTMTPTKRIYVVANLGGKGPNTTQEVNAVANFLQKNGDDRGPGDIDFEQVMPGYKAQTHMYTAAGIRWMLVKDFAGQYIYCWPEDDSHDSTAHIGHDEPEMKQLR